MRSSQNRLAPSGMLWFWGSETMEGPGTRDAPRGLGSALRLYR